VPNCADIHMRLISFKLFFSHLSVSSIGIYVKSVRFATLHFAYVAVEGGHLIRRLTRVNVLSP
jgi:hypothetical protein